MLPGHQHCLRGCFSDITGNSPMISIFVGDFLVVKKQDRSAACSKKDRGILSFFYFQFICTSVM